MPMVSGPTVLQLRSAGDTYPDWVTAENLQLPDNLPPEIVTLAHQITVRALTPYDKADAITQYLRSHITYSTTVGNPPPAGTRWIGSFLIPKKDFVIIMPPPGSFYCAAWVFPARLVVGFAQGEFSPPDLYVVREQDEHGLAGGLFPRDWVGGIRAYQQPGALVRASGGNLLPGGQGGSATPPFLPGQHCARPAHSNTGRRDGANSGRASF